ncbi:hypothetical protein JVU11DRAFT_6885 [Chiua virens]|nr:hypothetical protein JVU11DRAFT_6885 [Chiua virens]
MPNTLEIAVPLKHPEDTYSFTFEPEFPGRLTIQVTSSRVNIVTDVIVPHAVKKEHVKVAVTPPPQAASVLDPNDGSLTEPESTEPTPKKTVIMSASTSMSMSKHDISTQPTEWLQAGASSKASNHGGINKENLYKYEKPVAKCHK